MCKKIRQILQKLRSIIDIRLWKYTYFSLWVSYFVWNSRGAFEIPLKKFNQKL